jgi:hypothetical protein
MFGVQHVVVILQHPARFLAMIFEVAFQLLNGSTDLRLA